jgi:hypothetical protein
MTYAANEDLAMILPVPIATNHEDALRFISLKGYPQFFADMEKGFAVPTRGGAGGGGFRSVGVRAAATLPVYEVGDFVASFVPSLGDWGRLDRRFALPRQVWDRIPAYGRYGFAVFQLAAANRPRQVHPMAFAFASALPDRLFFPTVHIHDGQVHPRERFDHALYFQAAGRPDRSPRLPGGRFAAARGEAGQFLDIAKTQGIVSGAEKCFKLSLKGVLPNQDTFLRAG